MSTHPGITVKVTVEVVLNDQNQNQNLKSHAFSNVSTKEGNSLEALLDETVQKVRETTKTQYDKLLKDLGL